MTKEFTIDSPSMEEIMRKKKPVRKWVDIPLDPDVAQALADKEKELEQAEAALNREQTKATDRTLGRSLADGNNLSELQKTIDRLEKELDTLWDESEGTIVRFTFQDIGKKRYDDMVTEHPPTEEQKQAWKDEGGEGKLAYNTDTFPVALVAASSVDPEISPEYAERIFEEWGNWEVIRLFNAAVAACAGMSTVPKSRRSLIDTAETSTSN